WNPSRPSAAANRNWTLCFDTREWPRRNQPEILRSIRFRESSMKLNAALAGLTLLLVAGATLAQPVYRNVDKNGKVTFSDQPPSASAPAVPARAGGSSGAGTGLPYELRQVVQRYPVT